MTNLTVGNIVKVLCELLSIKNVNIAEMIGVNESSLSSNSQKLISDVRNNKTGKRILCLTVIVIALSQQQFNRTAIIEGLNEPTMLTLEGNRESVLTAIRTGRIADPMNLLDKAEEGVQKYVERKKNDDRDINEIKQTLLQQIA
jgi:hypothetical protein